MRLNLDPMPHLSFLSFEVMEAECFYTRLDVEWRVIENMIGQRGSCSVLHTVWFLQYDKLGAARPTPEPCRREPLIGKRWREAKIVF